MSQPAQNDDILGTSRKAATPYDRVFFDAIESSSLQSARIIVPMVLKVVQPRRVLDVGCGRGIWLREFQANGVPEVFGIDGPYIREAELVINPQCFRAVDLARPFRLDSHYDLAVCLEVAEHLPERSGKRLVHTLAAAAPVVLFSAAIPNQGGTHHINEQWPAYWESLFQTVEYRRLDPIRRHIVHDKRVATWYRQNVLLYASAKEIASSAILQMEEEYTREMPFDYIDREILSKLTSARDILRELPRTLLRASRHRIYSTGASASRRDGG